jgi:hypothetical protein
MQIKNDIIIKLILIYWLLLLLVQVFFDPFTTGQFVNKPTGGLTRVFLVEWGLIFNFAAVIPAAVIAIIKILQWKNRS